MFTVFYATGSGHFNMRMRMMCKRRGMLLNQFGLYKLVGEKRVLVPGIHTEAQLFAAIGSKPRTPTQRNY
jgi:DNA polymerase/3'-5' exonuclease PolX